MITFDESTWNISLPPGETVIGRQYDNLIRSLVISGVPEGWDWTLLVEASGKLDLIDLEPMEGGVGVTLTAQMLALSGFYALQLRGTQGDLVRHTNVLQVLVPKSLAGDATWPTVPSEFTQLEQRVQALAAETETAAAQAKDAAEGVVANAQAAQEAAGQAQTAQDAAQSSAQQAGTAAAAAADGAKTAADSAAAATQAAQSAGDAVRSAQASAQTATAQAQSAADAAQQAGQAKTAAETAAGSAAQSAQEAQAAAAVIPTPTKEDAGKVSAVNADGTAYELVPMSSGAVIDDTKAQTGKTWSSLTIVDRLAPAFEVSGPVVTCNPVEGYPLHVVSQIAPVQEGTGDPSPENVRPISGWAQATLTHNDTPITLPFSQTVYGGTLDWTTGILQNDGIIVELPISEMNGPNDDLNGMWVNKDFSGLIPVFGNEYNAAVPYGKIMYCNIINVAGKTESENSGIGLKFNGKIGTISMYKNTFGLAQADWKSLYPDLVVQIIFRRSWPEVFNLAPYEILALSGANTIYADTGDTTVSGRAEPNTVIQQLAARIAALEGAATQI